VKCYQTFQFRLYPTKRQVKALQASLDACRWVYNKTLEIRKDTYKERKESLSLYDTQKLLTEWKKDKPDLLDAYSQCLTNAQVRVDLAFKTFFRRVKTGEKPGYPRFRSFHRYDSFTFPQGGFKFVNDRLKLFKVGLVKIKKHRDIEGKIKTLTIRRDPVGKWWACFSCEVDPVLLPATDIVIGIDVGLESFATLSTGEKIPNPRFFRSEEKSLTKAQRKLSKAKKGTNERVKRRKTVAQIYSRIADKRKDFAHKTSLALVTQYGFIAFEKLEIKRMSENGFKGIRKSIGDVAWSQFMQFTSYKAECAGRKVVYVDPRYTSQRCSRCGQIVKKKLSVRVHSCSCGLVLDRDHNASINILALGLQSQGISPKSRLL